MGDIANDEEEDFMLNSKLITTLALSLIFTLPAYGYGTSGKIKKLNQRINKLELRVKNIEKELKKLKQPPAQPRPKIKWRSKIGIQSWRNNPVIIGKYLYVGSCGQTWDKSDPMDGLYSFDIETGRKRWFVHSGNDFNSCAYMEGLIVGGSDSGEVFAVSAYTGKVKWKKKLYSNVYATPCYTGAGVIIATGSGHLYLLDLKNGAQIDVKKLDGPVRGALASRNTDVWVGTENGYLYEIFAFGKLSISWQGRIYYPDQYGNSSSDDYLPGNLKFDYLNPGGFSPVSYYGAPLIMNDKIITGFVRQTYYSYPPIVSIDTRRRSVLWFGSDDKKVFEKQDEIFGNARYTPAVYKNSIICGNPYSNRIYALNSLNGNLMWYTDIGQPMFQNWPSPVVKGDYVYIARHDGYLSKLNAVNGKRIWSVFIGTSEEAGMSFTGNETVPGKDFMAQWYPLKSYPIYSTPAVSGNLIVAGTDEGYIYVING